MSHFRLTHVFMAPVAHTASRCCDIREHTICLLCFGSLCTFETHRARVDVTRMSYNLIVYCCCTVHISLIHQRLYMTVQNRPCHRFPQRYRAICTGTWCVRQIKTIEVIGDFTSLRPAAQPGNPFKHSWFIWESQGIREPEFYPSPPSKGPPPSMETCGPPAGSTVPRQNWRSKGWNQNPQQNNTVKERPRTPLQSLLCAVPELSLKRRIPWWTM